MSWWEEQRAEMCDDLLKLHSPTLGGLMNPCYGDGYFAASLLKKWEVPTIEGLRWMAADAARVRRHYVEKVKKETEMTKTEKTLRIKKVTSYELPDGSMHRTLEQAQQQLAIMELKTRLEINPILAAGRVTLEHLCEWVSDNRLAVENYIAACRAVEGRKDYEDD